MDSACADRSTAFQCGSFCPLRNPAMACAAEARTCTADPAAGVRRGPLVPSVARAFLPPTPHGFESAAGLGTPGAQARWLGDARMQTAQRRALAGHVGRVHGNRHLQGLIASLARTPAAGASHGPSPDAGAVRAETPAGPAVDDAVTSVPAVALPAQAAPAAQPSRCAVCSTPLHGAGTGAGTGTGIGARVQRKCSACEAAARTTRPAPCPACGHDPGPADDETASDTAPPSAHGLRIHRWPSADDVLDTLGSAASEVGDAADAAGDALAGAAADVGEGLERAAETVQDTAEGVAQTIVDTGSDVIDAAGDAIDWLATEAGQLATSLAESLGGIVSITADGLAITVPQICPLDAFTHEFDLESIDAEWMVPVAAIPPLLLVGEVGIAAHLQPSLAVQLGPFCLEGLRIFVNPLTNTWRVSGSVSATAAASLGAELRGGLRGALSLKAVVPVGGVPVPISVPLIGLEGGLAGLMRGTAAQRLTFGGGLGISGGTVSLDQTRRLDLGLAGDLFLGAYGQLDIRGENVCRLYWQPLEWHGDIAGSLGLSLGMTLAPGSDPLLTATVGAPTLTRLPFDQIPLALGREGFSEDCPVRDRLCEVLQALHLLPSQNGGSWNRDGPHGPGPRLPGPLEVYEKAPPIASGAQCRGACGPDCDTCTPQGTVRRVDPRTGETWEYADFQDCNTNGGCREHDAGFDWAAAEHGEVGGGAIVMPWHMAANVECACTNLAGNCVAWIAGLPPYDGKMYFAASAVQMPGGGGGGGGDGPVPQGSCRGDHPGAPDCNASHADRDAVLDAWGARTGIRDFRDCEVVQDGSVLGLGDCDGAPGRLWRCAATDGVTGEAVGLFVAECICCNDDDTAASAWKELRIDVDAPMSQELILELCARGLIPRPICEPVEDDMIGRFGDRRRDLNLDPDEDPQTQLRPDDAPILDSFRRIYNRLDSWNIYVRTANPELVPAFRQRFDLETRRQRWLDDLKRRTKDYKEEFRDIGRTDTADQQERYRQYVLGTIQQEIDATNHEIARWYLAETHSNESEDEVIERVHGEGTELWREAWRRAILQVNRVLARLWPPAKTTILVWIGQQRMRLPHVDLTGSVGELDYIGSLATGFKGPPKQQIRFNPDKFDVDANLPALPLAKYAVAVDHLRPDRGRIFGRTTTIAPLIAFSDQAHTELSAQANTDGRGYNRDDPFDVAIDAPELPEQERHREATERLYRLRDELDAAEYGQMLGELRAGGFLTADGSAVREDLTEAEAAEVNAILDRHTRPA